MTMLAWRGLARRHRLLPAGLGGVCLAVLAAVLDGESFAVPGGTPTPDGLAILSAGVVVALAPISVERAAHELQAVRGGLTSRVVGTSLGVGVVLPVALVSAATMGVAITVTWTGVLGAVGLGLVDRLGAAVWAPVTLLAMVAFVLAGRVDEHGHRWLIETSGRSDVAAASLLVSAAALALHLLAPGRRRVSAREVVL